MGQVNLHIWVKWVTFVWIKWVTRSNKIMWLIILTAYSEHSSTSDYHSSGYNFSAGYSLKILAGDDVLEKRKRER